MGPRTSRVLSSPGLGSSQGLCASSSMQACAALGWREANVGEQQPAVLAEHAAGAAHNGVTVSTLGFGFDYNIALMSQLAEAGNGDFTHIESLESLDAVLREEFTAAAEVTARGVEVTVDLPERLSAGTNLNAYRQEPRARGFFG